MTEYACIYARSSKDAHDISPATQMQELKKFAGEKYKIVAEFSDAAVSANADPPQLKLMLAELENPNRKWTTILAVDSSRLARDADFAGVIAFKARKAGVKIIFAKQPPTGTQALDIIISQVARAWDQYHSMVSKEKGLAGLRMNVQLGHRAGGRPPLGYQLEHTATGTIRNGAPVRKSKLVLDPETSRQVKRYLVARINGKPRVVAAEKCGLKRAMTTWIGIERNALVYAGHTVWNRHSEIKGQRYNPRSDWVIHRDTHAAMISEESAELLMTAAMPRPERRRRMPTSQLLLSGLLFTPDGAAMVSSGDGYYRAGKGLRFKAEELELAVLTFMEVEMDTKEFLEGFMGQLRSETAQMISDPEESQKSLSRIQRAIDNLLKMAEEAPGSPSLLGRLKKLEAEKAEAEDHIARAADAALAAKTLKKVGLKDLRHWFDAWSDIGGTTVEERREALSWVVERVVFDPHTRTGQIHYRAGGAGRLHPGYFCWPLSEEAAKSMNKQMGVELPPTLARARRASGSGAKLASPRG